MCREIHGKLLESATLGCCTAQRGSYLPRREAMELVRKHQPRDKRPAICRLEAEVAKQLSMTVVFFTAVRSALDEFHSIDGFFQIGRLVVTIDLTDNPTKFSGKADVIVQADDFEDLQKLAARIVREFNHKLGLVSRSGIPRTTRVWRAA